jgi:hypothetical protein
MAVTLCSIVLFPSIIRAWTPSFANLSPCLVCFDKGANKGSQVYRCTDRVAFVLMMIICDIAAGLNVRIAYVTSLDVEADFDLLTKVCRIIR